jgi:hypothetical protein
LLIEGTFPPQNGRDPDPYYCISPQDHTNRMTVSGIFELPFGRGRRFLSGAGPWANGIAGG